MFLCRKNLSDKEIFDIETQKTCIEMKNGSQRYKASPWAISCT